jgi:hypothetical protein
MNTCAVCHAGTFSDQEAGAACMPCLEGTYSREGSKQCTLCPAGTFSDSQQASSPDTCVTCPADSVADIDGSSSCAPCDIGFGAPVGAVTCTRVPPGTFNDGSGTQFCPPGKYSNETGSASCTDCPLGSYSRALGGDRPSCSPCPIGTFGDTTGAAECKHCQEGTYTTLLGSKSESACELAPDAIDYNSAQFQNLSIDELFEIDLLVAGTNSSRLQMDRRKIDRVVAIRARQLGNGFCNQGPWNTFQGNWDGGDCCPQSCVIPKSNDLGENQTLLELACTRTTFRCLDPHFKDADITFPVCAREGSPAVGADSLENDGIGVTMDPRTSASLLGDGVCDLDLNTADFVYDGGDCCAATCVTNPKYPQSCVDSPEVCIDPDVTGFDLATDTDKPVLLFDFPVDEGTFEVSELPRSPAAAASDNDPCFVGFVQLAETRVDGFCPNDFSLTRTWFVSDAAGNTAFKTTTLNIEDTTPPIAPATGRFCIRTGRKGDQLDTWVQIDLKRFLDSKDDCGSTEEDCDDSTTVALVNCVSNQSTTSDLGEDCLYDATTGTLSLYVDLDRGKASKLIGDGLRTRRLKGRGMRGMGGMSKRGRRDDSPSNKAGRVGDKSKKDRGKGKDAPGPTSRIYSAQVAITDSCSNVLFATLDFVVESKDALLQEQESECTESLFFANKDEYFICPPGYDCDLMYDCQEASEPGKEFMCLGLSRTSA